MNEALPGADLIEAGIEDLRAGRETAESLLVAIGAPRLRTIGIDVPAHKLEHPEMRLYELLAKHDSDSAHERSSNPRLRSLFNKIVRVDYPDGVGAIRSDLAFLQSL